MAGFAPRRALAWTLAALVALGLCLLVGFPIVRRFPTPLRLEDRSSTAREDEVGPILRWAARQELRPESSQLFALPRGRAAASRGGTVHIGRSKEGRTCILLKKEIGWKDNFTGTVACDRRLLAQEIVDSAKDRPYLSLPGEGPFEELYVARRLSDTCFEVYFDLN